MAPKTTTSTRSSFRRSSKASAIATCIAASGDEAVRLWTEHKPQIVLMDISLPGLNGFEAARIIRQMEETGRSQTPIIGVLTQAFERDRAECTKAGMDDVIMKPISPDMLETVFQKYLCRMSRMRAPR